MVVRFALISSFLLHRVQSTDTQYLYHHPAAVRVSVASTLEVIYSLKDRSTDWPAGRSTVWVNWLDGEIAALFFSRLLFAALSLSLSFSIACGVRVANFVARPGAAWRRVTPPPPPPARRSGAAAATRILAILGTYPISITFAAARKFIATARARPHPAQTSFLSSLLPTGRFPIDFLGLFCPGDVIG